MGLQAGSTLLSLTQEAPGVEAGYQFLQVGLNLEQGTRRVSRI